MKLSYNNESIESNINNATIKEKYSMLSRVLTKVENDKLYKGDTIKGNEKLEERRKFDIKNLKKVISDELKNDGIKSIFINGRTLKQLY